MFVVWGSKLYGKVDQVEGAGHVATEFGHLYFIPIIPKASYFVTEQNTKEFKGKQIALSMKSVLVTYTQAAAIVFGIGSLLLLIGWSNPPEGSELDRTPMNLLWTCGICFGSMVAFAVTKLEWAQRATYELASQLVAQDSASDPRMQVWVDLQYEKIDVDEADRQMTKLESGIVDFEDLQDELAASGLSQSYALSSR